MLDGLDRCSCCGRYVSMSQLVPFPEKGSNKWRCAGGCRPLPKDQIMKTIIAVLVLGTAAVIATPVSAAGCRVVKRQVVVKKQVVVQKVVKQVAAVQAVLPVVSAFVPAAVLAYGAAYAPGTAYAGGLQGGVAGINGAQQGSGQESELISVLKQLDARLQALEQRVGIQQQGTPAPMEKANNGAALPTPRPNEAVAEVTKLFVTKCAQCHQQGRQQAGSGFVLLDTAGNLALLSAEKQKEVLRRVYSQDPKVQMPRSGKALNDEELSLVVNWIAN